MADLKLWETYLEEARQEAELGEGKDNVNTSDKQKNPQPDGDPNKDTITNPGE